jgi:PIN domain nuclease of toxin-antitoxin system
LGSLSYLLDTCTFIWLCADPEKLSATAREAIDADAGLLLRDVSALEITLKWQAGKLELPDHHRDPFDRLLVATALAAGATILTPDPAVRRYPISTRW